MRGKRITDLLNTVSLFKSKQRIKTRGFLVYVNTTHDQIVI